MLLSCCSYTVLEVGMLLSCCSYTVLEVGMVLSCCSYTVLEVGMVLSCCSYTVLEVGMVLSCCSYTVLEVGMVLSCCSYTVLEVGMLLSCCSYTVRPLFVLASVLIGRSYLVSVVAEIANILPGDNKCGRDRQHATAAMYCNSPCSRQFHYTSEISICPELRMRSWGQLLFGQAGWGRSCSC